MKSGTDARGSAAPPPRTSRRLALGCLALAVAVAAPRVARAESPCGGDPAVCLNSDTFWPSPGPSRFAGVSGTQTTTPGELSLGLVTSYQSRPIALRTASPGPSGASAETFAIDDQVTTNFLWQYGITSRLGFDAALPITLGQSGAGLSALTGGEGVKATSIRDLRFGVALALIPRARVDVQTSQKARGAGHSYALTLRVGATAPIGDKADLAGERTTVFTPALAGDYRVGRVSLGAELGARVRPTSNLLGARIGTQIATGLGGGFDVLPRELLTVQLEARALVNLAEQADVTRGPSGTVSTPNGRLLVPAEWLLSVRTAPLASGDLSLLLGGGGGLSPDTVTVPRFRFVLGITYAPEGRDSDGDGIVDKYDRCPQEPQRGEPRDGCDHTTPSSAPRPETQP
ncbi:MAG: hypothetical protein IPF92_02215 [Myxococcales bacterium]|nr:hypothetical protein [Myxococcales bacterium]MBL0193942.1 hypothetical protein [Myxococcales bacterium]HQY61949.1 hypothetical protein [Polyangiaceae bacterium]